MGDLSPVEWNWDWDFKVASYLDWFGIDNRETNQFNFWSYCSEGAD